MESSAQLNDLEKKILKLLDDVPLESGIPSSIRDLLQQAGQVLAMKITRDLLASREEKKRSHGKKIAMYVDPEENVKLILPLLDDANWLIRWQTLHSVTRTNKFLEEDKIIKLVIKRLIEDSSPEVRVEAAEALGYCKIYPQVISALEYARDHDFEFDRNGYQAGDIASDALKRIRERQNNSM